MADNIQVVVRVRARNAREIAAKSPSVVEVSEDSSNPFVTIKNDTLGVDLSSKTYKVDQVYGSHADQHAIFTNVARPLFHDFLNGLNVTILAYGQTGTGKTYTMCGDEGDGGIIPRILHELFTLLEDDFVVKVLCVELYKEELRDLLDEDARLRIVADGPKSIVIQNLHEVHIHNEQGGIAALKKCWDRRRTGATKLNDQLSRLHAIFTLLLFRKSGDTAYRVSKMNLVDLAGSEDVNKSGAVNQRAKEAGAINQSLLTLGKVINCLSEGKDTRHIPYRDSKLTRLLQDSIGGRTKTALIATVSPAKINITETVSTLNYASKAKDIKNLPQISLENEMVLKRILVQDLLKEIARLNKDLMALRDKEGGIKMSVDNYHEHQRTIRNYETELRERDAHVSALQAKVVERDAAIARLEAQVAASREAENRLALKQSEQDSRILALSEDYTRLKEQHLLQTERLSRIIDCNLEDMTTSVQGILRRLQAGEVPSSFARVQEQLQSSVAGLRFELDRVGKQIHECMAGDDIKHLLEERLSLAKLTLWISSHKSVDIGAIEEANAQFAEVINKQAVSLEASLQKLVQAQTAHHEALKQKMLKQLIRTIDESFAASAASFETSIGEFSSSASADNKQVLSRHFSRHTALVATTVDSITSKINELHNYVQEYADCHRGELGAVASEIQHVYRSRVEPYLAQSSEVVSDSRMAAISKEITGLRGLVLDSTNLTQKEIALLDADLNKFRQAVEGDPVGVKKSPLRGPSPIRKRTLLPVKVGNNKENEPMRTKIPQLRDDLKRRRRGPGLNL